MRLHRLFLSGIAALCLSVAYTARAAEGEQGDLAQQAEQAYRTGQYKQALDIWAPLADNGNAEANRSIGFLYEHGLGVNKSLIEAIKRYEQAADAGSVAAQYRVGQMYLTGEAGRQDFNRAFAMLQKAAQAGHAGAQYNLGVMYEQGVGTPPDPAGAATWIGKAAAQGHDKAGTKITQLQSAPSNNAVAANSPPPADAKLSQQQQQFNDRNGKPANQIAWNENLQKRGNKHFFGTEGEVNRTPVTDKTGVNRPAPTLDSDATGNPFDPVRPNTTPDKNAALPPQPNDAQFNLGDASGAAAADNTSTAKTPLAPVKKTEQQLSALDPYDTTGSMPPPASASFSRKKPATVADLPQSAQGNGTQSLTVPITNGDASAVESLRAQAQNNPKAAYKLGRMYYRGEGGVEQNFERAHSLWKYASDKGYGPAITALANLEARLEYSKNMAGKNQNQ